MKSRWIDHPVFATIGPEVPEATRRGPRAPCSSINLSAAGPSRAATVSGLSSSSWRMRRFNERGGAALATSAPRVPSFLLQSVSEKALGKICSCLTEYLRAEFANKNIDMTIFVRHLSRINRWRISHPSHLSQTSQRSDFSVQKIDDRFVTFVSASGFAFAEGGNAL